MFMTIGYKCLVAVYFWFQAIGVCDGSMDTGEKYTMLR